MTSALKITAAITFGLLVGGGAVQMLHAQSKPPAFVVAEIAVKDEKGYDENFQKATQKDILNHGGKYLAGGYNKTLSLVGDPPPNRVVILAVREYGRGQGVARSGCRRYGEHDRQQIREVPYLCSRWCDPVV